VVTAKTAGPRSGKPPLSAEEAESDMSRSG
jgi:hypothetical protein